MAGDDDDLALNTLHRFAKQSPRLVLHEYSHCEVPAGCGGVILRWIDPADGAPCIVTLRGEETQGTVWLDGAEVSSGICLVRDGGRVLAVRVERRAGGAQPFVVSVRPDGDHQVDHLSSGAPTWTATTTPPPENWTAPDFDDRAWREPESGDALYADLDKWRRNFYDTARMRGQRVFAIATDQLWLRCAFTFARRR